MLRTLLILPDGTQLFSGSTGAAVVSATLTRMVNDQQELTVGSVCPAMLECQLTEAAAVQIQPGQELTLYHVDDHGNRYLQGIFLAQKPVRKGWNLELTAYDRLMLLDRDLSGWLEQLDQWPYTLQTFCQMVCQACGLEFKPGQMLSGEHLVQPFRASSVTGRQLLSWAAQAAGCFCRANPEGVVEFDWYQNRQICLIPEQDSAYFDGTGLSLHAEDAAVTQQGQELILNTRQLVFSYDGQADLAVSPELSTPRVFLYEGGVQLADYTVAQVEKVRIKCSREDVGTVWPDDPRQLNTFQIEDNCLLTAQSPQTLQPVARNLFERLEQVSYSPCKLTIPAVPGIDAGNILRLTDGTGRLITLYVMQQRIYGARMELECTGSATREGSTVANNYGYKALCGKVLQLQTDVDGIRAENRDAAGRQASIEMDVAGIRSNVQLQQELADGMLQQMTALEQTAQTLSIEVKSIQQTGVNRVETATGYRFSEEGLQIRKPGEQIENLIDNTGMYVKRNGNILLRADDNGVAAVDVTIGNYLVVGEHARFEDYGSGRTACFWL